MESLIWADVYTSDQSVNEKQNMRSQNTKRKLCDAKLPKGKGNYQNGQLQKIFLKISGVSIKTTIYQKS